MKDKLRLALEIAENMKAEDIKILDLSGFDTCGSVHIIMTAGSERHLSSLARELLKAFKGAGMTLRSEGMQAKQWLLVDCEDTVIHIFTKESRAFYAIERLWQTQPEQSSSSDG